MAEMSERTLESKVVALYEKGYSQKEITKLLKITAPTIRSILQEKGFATRKFRALDDNVTNIIIHLVSSGVYFVDIEEVCDIAFHAIRDLVARHDLQHASKRARSANSFPVVQTGYIRNEEFLARYMKGESFCALSKDFGLNNDQILNEFLSITKNHIRKHKANLRKKILHDAARNYSVTSIARKHTVSVSVVRQILKQAESK